MIMSITFLRQNNLRRQSRAKHSHGYVVGLLTVFADRVATLMAAVKMT